MSGANPLAFVVGCPRSGTTLLQRMLDAHPQLCVANDTHFIARAVSSVVPTQGMPATLRQVESRGPELIAWARAYHRFPRLGLCEEAVERAARTQRFSGFVERLYEELARAKGARWAAEKTPDYVRHIPLLHTLFPQARFVHIVRDGRDVALSLRAWATERKGPGRLAFWSENEIATAALWWRWQVGEGLRGAAAVGSERVHMVIYERLVAQPEAELRRVASFLGLRFRREMLEFHVGRQRDDPRLDAKKAWLPPTAGLRRWREQLTTEEIEIFEHIAGDLLEELGYERGATVRSLAARHVAERFEGLWRDERDRRARARARRVERLPEREEAHAVS